MTRRSVNPGNNVQAGQQLMAVRSLTEIWVDANFKETQLADLRIGQPVDLYVDMYGDRRTFRGRVAGFTTGPARRWPCCPPENATGNFVKVVQRLPGPDRADRTRPPADAPLFAGLSVTPYVHYREPPTGPDAGQKLQARPAPASRPRPPAEPRHRPPAHRRSRPPPGGPAVSRPPSRPAATRG